MNETKEIPNTKIEDKSRVSVRNENISSADQTNISYQRIRYKIFIPIVVFIILIPIVITVPIFLLNKTKVETNTTTTITTTTTTEVVVPLDRILNDKTKWNQNGITIFHQPPYPALNLNLYTIDIDNDQIIYISTKTIHRVIKSKFNQSNILIVPGRIRVGTDVLKIQSDFIIDEATNSIIICDSGYHRIVRWSRQNEANAEIIIPNMQCQGLAMDDKGYLYVSDWLKKEVRRWDIRLNNQSTLIAGGHGDGKNLNQFNLPTFISVDKDYSIYVADQTNHRVMKWIKDATEGIIVAGGNEKGDQLNQLFSPAGIIVDHLGNIYVTDRDNHRVMRWINGAKEGTVVVGGNGPGNETDQLNNPSDLLFDKYGNLYVLELGNYRLQKFLIQSN